MNLVIEDVVYSHFRLKLNKSIDLAKMWSFIVSNNPGRENTYHNTQHMKHMAAIACYLFENSDAYKVMSPAEQHLQTNLLLIACCWHDYGHSAGKTTDVENIRVASDAFMEWFETNWVSMVPYLIGKKVTEGKSEDEREAANLAMIVLDIIKVTEFPFVHRPHGTLQMCARDADLLYTFDTDTGKIVHGLYMELKSSGKFPQGFSFMNFMNRQADFLDSCEHFTPLGKQIHETMKADVLARQFEWAESQGFA